jgi:zinc D-Ala-D-Ala carboxypeptidase
MNISPHFTLAEMTASQTAARAGLDNTPPAEALERLQALCKLLEEVRAWLYFAPVQILSGYRSGKVNALVRGSPNSQHMKGEAADFIAPRFGSPQSICTSLIKSGIEYDQLILEFGGWVHISTAEHPRRMALTIDRAGTRPMLT